MLKNLFIRRLEHSFFVSFDFQTILPKICNILRRLENLVAQTVLGETSLFGRRKKSI